MHANVPSAEDDQLRHRRPGDLNAGRVLNEQGDVSGDDGKTPRSDEDDEDVDQVEERFVSF